MLCPRFIPRGRLATLVAVWVLGAALPTPSALAQEICGDGTTFTVNLPSINGGAGDSVAIPRGCRIYALLVSGYSRNDKLDELTFYELAKFVTENNGYVHWAWWNNLLKEYLGRPLHTDETFTNPITGRVFGPTPGGLTGVHLLGFVPADHELGIVPKAVPQDDFQFQADATRLLAAIHAQNPDALIVVAGHSMGGNAVARLGANTPTRIDLLAPIDPVGNRSSPVGRPTSDSPIPDHTFNWTRWRATREFAGFKVRDCVRNALGLCKNFGSFLNPDYHCTTVGGLWTTPPPFPGSLAPRHCPGPWEDPGKLLTFGGRIKRLYYRWQTEAIFPFDFKSTEYFPFWAPRNVGGPTTAINVQLPVVTCAIGVDPLDSSRLCDPTDGHGEIVGFRTPTPGQPNPPGPNVPVAPLALQALNWPQFDGSQSTADQQAGAHARQLVLLEMPTADDSWPHRPMNPDLDLVSADMVEIVRQLLASQPVWSPPTTVAVQTPGPNDHGWNNEDVVVTLTATAGSGRSIRQIEYSLAGAQAAGTTVSQGNTVDIPMTAEGESTITFQATDDAGTVEEPETYTVRLDKTPPQIVAAVSPKPNAGGWNNSDVKVTFSAEDALSGVDTVDPEVVLSEEGAGQEAIGSATDLAGNTAATTATVNIDKTAPLISGMPSAGCSLWPPNHKLTEVARITASDGLSGVPDGALIVTGTRSEPAIGAAPDIVVDGGGVWLRAARAGTSLGRTYTLGATVSDAAGNIATRSASCVVPHDMRR